MNTGIPIDSMTSNIVILEGLCWFLLVNIEESYSQLQNIVAMLSKMNQANTATTDLSMINIYLSE